MHWKIVNGVPTFTTTGIEVAARRFKITKKLAEKKWTVSSRGSSRRDITHSQRSAPLGINSIKSQPVTDLHCLGKQCA
jgi:hypothetical protein